MVLLCTALAMSNHYMMLLSENLELRQFARATIEIEFKDCFWKGYLSVDKRYLEEDSNCSIS